MISPIAVSGHAAPPRHKQRPGALHVSRGIRSQEAYVTHTLGADRFGKFWPRLSCSGQADEEAGRARAWGRTGLGLRRHREVELAPQRILDQRMLLAARIAGHAASGPIEGLFHRDIPVVVL